MMKMRRQIHISKNLEGFLLCYDVYTVKSNKKILLLRKNNFLTSNHIELMINHGVQLLEVWMTDDEYGLLNERD